MYQTAPVGPPQPDYFNAAIAVESSHSPLHLLQVLLEVEQGLGRVRPDPVRWGPRTIDIDVLWYADGEIRLPGLTVPHPRLHERAFALRPMLDVAPDATEPGTDRRYASFPAARIDIARVDEL